MTQKHTLIALNSYTGILVFIRVHPQMSNERNQCSNFYILYITHTTHFLRQKGWKLLYTDFSHYSSCSTTRMDQRSSYYCIKLYSEASLQ